MPRKKKQEVEAASQDNGATVADHSIAPPETLASGVLPAGDMPDAPQGEPDGETQRGTFRSWVSDTGRGYTRMTNDERQSIVLQFVAKPDEEVRVALKEAGFQFKPDYFGQKSCWVRRNDFEGRVQLESVEKLLMSRSAEAELPAF